MMRNIPIAKFESKRAYLSTDFGLGFAQELLGIDEAALAERMGRYVRGKRKGSIKGCIEWIKCIQGGWVHRTHGGYGGFVCRYRGRIVAAKLTQWGDRSINEISRAEAICIYDVINKTTPAAAASHQ